MANPLYPENTFEERWALPVEAPQFQTAVQEPVPQPQPTYSLTPVDYDPWEIAAARTRAPYKNRNMASVEPGSVIDKLAGVHGERYQLWPEKMIRSGLSLPHDVFTGEEQFLPLIGTRREDFTDVPRPTGPTKDSTWLGRVLNVAPVAAQPLDRMIERTQDLAGLGVTGPLAMRPGTATLGSGAVGRRLGPADYERIISTQREIEGIKAAIRDPETNKVYTGYTHREIMDQLGDELGKERMKEIINSNNKSNIGFLNENGKFMPRNETENKFGISTVEDLKNLRSKIALFRADNEAGTAIGAVNKSINANVPPAPRFYSAVEHAVDSIPENALTGEQWFSKLWEPPTTKTVAVRDANNRPTGETKIVEVQGRSPFPGVKPDELNWIGLNDFLNENKGKVLTKNEVNDFIQQNKVELKEVQKFNITPEMEKKISDKFEAENGPKPKSWKEETDPLKQVEADKAENAWMKNHAKYMNDELSKIELPKYKQYQLPGGENYREMLLTLPVKTSPKATEALALTKRMNDGEFNHLNGTERRQLFIKHDELLQQAREEEGRSYTSSHWSEPNVLAHTRVNDRVMPIEFTAEEKAALQAHENAKPAFDQNVKEQHKVALQIQDASKLLETERRKSILADVKAGKISNPEANRRLEDYKPPVELKPLQDKLAQLRAEEDKLRASLPAKPTQKTVKSLHVEEIQSDWHQAGRDKGYKGNTSDRNKRDIQKDIDDVLTELRTKTGEYLPTDKHWADNPTLTANFEKLAEEYKNAKDIIDDRVPDAPFKKTWHELALKRLIREAAEKGYERLSWTPGEAQAARYDLSKQIDQVILTHNRDGVGTLEYFDKKGNKNTQFVKSKEDLSSFIGKDLANKLYEQGYANNGVARLSGLDLKIGGEGMKGFYDNIIPKAVEKLGKEWGVKVQKGEIPFGGQVKYLVQKDGINSKYFDTHEQARQHAKENGGIVIKNTAKGPVHYIDIPPAMRESVLRKGMPLFQSGVPFTFTPVDYDPWAVDQKTDNK